MLPLRNPFSPALQTPSETPSTWFRLPSTSPGMWGRGDPLTLPHDGTQVQDAGLVDTGPTARSGPGAGLPGEGGSEVQP